MLVFPPVNNYHRFLIHKVGRWVDAPTGSNWQTNIVMLSKLLFFLPHTNQKMNMVMFPQQKIVEMLLAEGYAYYVAEGHTRTACSELKCIDPSLHILV